MSTSTPPLSKDQRAEVARLASCDRRTVDSYLMGDAIRKMARSRIEETLRFLGLDAHIRPAAAS